MVIVTWFYISHSDFLTLEYSCDGCYDNKQCVLPDTASVYALTFTSIIEVTFIVVIYEHADKYKYKYK